MVAEEIEEFLGGAGAAAKLFGPSLSAGGDAFGRATTCRLRNLGRVTENAEKKVKGDSGSIPTRLALAVMNEGTYADEPIVVEYLGGILASGRMPEGRDDSATPFSALVARMSTHELRAHFVIYTALRQCGPRLPPDLNPFIASELETRPMALPLSFLYEAHNRDATWMEGFLGALWNLEQENLIGEVFALTSGDGSPAFPQFSGFKDEPYFSCTIAPPRALALHIRGWPRPPSWGLLECRL